MDHPAIEKCCFGGYHKTKTWHGGKGVSCWRCHQTWAQTSKYTWEATYAPSEEKGGSE